MMKTEMIMSLFSELYLYTRLGILRVSALPSMYGFVNLYYILIMVRNRVDEFELRKIRDMRRKGYSIGEIAKDMRRGQTTIIRHIKGVKVLPEHIAKWKSKRGGSANRAINRRQKSLSIALKKLGALGNRDQLLIAACLYWGEGSKREFGFTNTDPRLIKAFLKCLYALGLEKERLKISIRIYEDIDSKKAKSYWAKVIGISASDIGSVNVLEGKKKGKLPFGMCRIRLVNGNDYFNLMMATIQIICNNYALVAQWIEPRTPKPQM